jgi:hypothetical protein
MREKNREAGINAAILSIEAVAVYQGKTYTQRVLVRGKNASWYVFDPDLIMEDKHVGSNRRILLLAYLGRIEMQTVESKRIEVDKELNLKEIARLYGEVLEVTIHPHLEAPEPNIHLDFLLDVGEGIFECSTTSWFENPRDHELLNLKAGDFIVFYPMRIDLNKI